MKSELERLLTAHRAEIDIWLTMTDRITLLEQVANGEHGVNGCNADDGLYESVSIYMDDVIAMLHRSAWGDDEIPESFWNTDIGRMMQRVIMWLECDDLITLSEAAVILRGASENRDLVAVNGYIKRGKLKAYTNPDEPNPTYARRVKRSEVEGLKHG